jgi:HEPN domain-containing protein
MADRVADLLLRAAAHDIAACVALAHAPGIDDSIIGFHAQQACEKCLKAVLSAGGIEFGRTHDLVRLTSLLEASGCTLPPVAQGIDLLNPYAVEGRYGLVDAGRLDRAAALEVIDTMFAWAKETIAPARPAGS